MSQPVSPIRESLSDARAERGRTGARLLVVTPTLGNSPYLEATVACVRGLGIEHEHVLVAPQSAIPALQSRFPALTLVAEEKGAGMYGALNSGLAAARSDWTWFTYLNDDDLLGFDQSVPIALVEIQNQESLAIYGRCVAIDKMGRTIFPINVAKDSSALADLLHWGFVPLTQQGLVFSRLAWRKLRLFDTTYTHGADLDVIIRALNHGIPFRFLPGIVGSFRVHSGQLSKHAEKMRVDRLRAVAGLTVGRRSLLSWAYYRLTGASAMLQRMRRFGLKRVHEIYETQE